MAKTTTSACAPDTNAHSPAVTFYRLIDKARLPTRAERHAGGALPLRAQRHCEAAATASAFGWWLYSPMDLSLLWTGEIVLWKWDGHPDWMKLEAAQFPWFAERFNQAVPEAVRGGSPPFLACLPEAGCVQLWTGLLARTAPEWSLLVRAPANRPSAPGHDLYEGIVEADRWFGPVFTNLRLTRRNVPVHLRAVQPLAQIQPIPRIAYSTQVLDRASAIYSLEEFSDKDWDDYINTVIKPSDDPNHRPGRYAAAARRRGRREGCPFSGNQLPFRKGPF